MVHLRFRRDLRGLVVDQLLEGRQIADRVEVRVVSRHPRQSSHISIAER